jgi:protein-S-isoprenylcysteine O-methyltransferase Ste14
VNEHNDHADVKIHPPILTLVFIALAYAAKWVIPLSLIVPAVMRWIGFGLIVIGFLLGVAAMLAFRNARTTLNPHGQVSAIVRDGVYRFTRNPIYLGFLLMLIGLPLNSGNYWGLLLAPLFIASMNSLVIEKEEVYLEKKFKDVYTRYKSGVRRWV